MYRTLFAAACALVLVGVAPLNLSPLGPSNAVAQNGEDMEKARKFFKKGKSAYSSEKYKKAAEAFLKAYEYSGRTELLFNIGQAYRKAGDLQNAEKYLQQYLNERPNADNSDKVVQKVIEIQQEIAAKMGNIEVKTKREGQSVFINDEEEYRCKTPCSVSLSPGTHTVHVRGEGMLEESRELDIEKSTDRTLEIELTPEDAVGHLYVKTPEGGGALAIDGRDEVSLPLDSPMQLEKGSYGVTVTGSSGGNWNGEVEIPGGETVRLMVPLDVSKGGSGGGSGFMQPLAIGLGGASVGLLTGGALFGSAANQTHNSLKNSSGPRNSNLVATGRREQRTANILYGAGATTLLASGGILAWKYLVKSDDSSKSETEQKEQDEEPDSLAPVDD